MCLILKASLWHTAIADRQYLVVSVKFVDLFSCLAYQVKILPFSSLHLLLFCLFVCLEETILSDLPTHCTIGCF